LNEIEAKETIIERIEKRDFSEHLSTMPEEK